jgi:hypothetical protein
VFRQHQRQGSSSNTLTARISKRALAMPPAPEDVVAGSLLPEDADLEAVVLRGENECVVDAE